MRVVPFLVEKISSRTCVDSILVPALASLAACVRCNMGFKIHLREMDSISTFYHTLISMLAHQDVSVVVYSLSILWRLVLSDPLGDKLFSPQNLGQTFQLVFDLVADTDPSGSMGNVMCLNYACVDLLSDLVCSTSVVTALETYEALASSTAAIFAALTGADSKSLPESQLQLLMALLTSSHKLRQLISSTIIEKKSLVQLFQLISHAHVPSGCAAAKFLTCLLEEDQPCREHFLQEVAFGDNGMSAAPTEPSSPVGMDFDSPSQKSRQQTNIESTALVRHMFGPLIGCLQRCAEDASQDQLELSRRARAVEIAHLLTVISRENSVGKTLTKILPISEVW